MSVLKILEYPDPRLRLPNKPVEDIQSVQTLIDDMIETVHHGANSVGLAAPQVDAHYHLIVIDLSREKNDPMVLINPKIITTEGKETMEEGCLSFPGVYVPVTRAKRIVMEATDRHGDIYEIDNDDFLARCIQHEIDHINGVLFVDYLSALKRNRIRKKLEKYHRLHETE